jgi:TPR repeat protein
MTANLDIDIEDSLESLGQDIATCRSAQYNLGVMHNNGEGVPQDYVQAHMWWNLAAVSGDEDAIGNRNIVAEDMTPAQLAEAQKLAREWKPTD